jgi:hypothetical protein
MGPCFIDAPPTAGDMRITLRNSDYVSLRSTIVGDRLKVIDGENGQGLAPVSDRQLMARKSFRVQAGLFYRLF